MTRYFSILCYQFQDIIFQVSAAYRPGVAKLIERGVHVKNMQASGCRTYVIILC